MGDRMKLPARRNSLVIEVKHPMMPATVQVGFYDDGRIGEFFIHDAGKAGSYADTAARDFAVGISIALQYGAPLDVLAGAMMKTEAGRPDGLGGAVLAALIKLQNDVRGE